MFCFLSVGKRFEKQLIEKNLEIKELDETIQNQTKELERTRDNLREMRSKSDVTHNIFFCLLYLSFLYKNHDKNFLIFISKSKKSISQSSYGELP